MNAILDLLKWLFPDPKKSVKLMIAFTGTIAISFGGSFFSYKYSVAKASDKIEIVQKNVYQKVESESEIVQAKLEAKEEVLNTKLNSQHTIILGALNNIQANQKRNEDSIKDVNKKVWQLSQEIKNSN